MNTPAGKLNLAEFVISVDALPVVEKMLGAVFVGYNEIARGL